MLKTTIEINGNSFTTDLHSPIDISIPIGRVESPNAFYLTKPVYETVEAGNFVGNVARGGSCNCENIFFNPHGDGTHTECAGHVAKEKIYINESLTRFFFLARLISVPLSEKNGSRMILAEDVQKLLRKDSHPVEAIIIRSLPNEETKKQTNYSGANPAYFEAACMDLFNSMGIKHILTDLPSLDKEDDSELTAHKIFFGFPNQWNLEKTVTEMIYVPNEIMDDMYLLNLQIASFESDASPSKPVLYSLESLAKI